MPLAERLLRAKLRAKGLSGYKFRRQYSVEGFVLDFYCPQSKLAIELDGESHFLPGAQDRDDQRAKTIEGYGIRVLRFTNTDVYKNMQGVLSSIVEHVEIITSPNPSL